jgi:hypothetical protein
MLVLSWVGVLWSVRVSPELTLNFFPDVIIYYAAFYIAGTVIHISVFIGNPFRHLSIYSTFVDI